MDQPKFVQRYGWDAQPWRNLRDDGRGNAQSYGRRRARITGTLNNSGATLALNAVTGTWNLAGGTIRGGVITTSTGAGLEVSGFLSGGILDGVTLNGNATVRDLAVLTVTNGLTLNGTLTVTTNEGGGRSQVVFTAGPQSLLGTGEIVLGGASNSSRLLLGNNTLTVGPGLTIRGQGSIEQTVDSTLINQGAFVGDQPGKLLWSNLTAFVNQGVVAASGGDFEFVTSPANLFNGVLTGGFWTASDGSIDFGGPVLVNSASIVLRGSEASFKEKGANALLTSFRTQPRVSFVPNKVQAC